MRVLSVLLACSLLFLMLMRGANASHKPISNKALAYATINCFKNAGGIEAAQLYLKTLTEEYRGLFQTEDDLRLLFKASGLDYDKVQKASMAMLSSFQLFNSGIPIEAAVRLVQDAEEGGVDIKNPTLVVFFAFKAKGMVLEDTTSVSEALRQGEMLKHLGQKSRMAFIGNGLDLNLIFTSEEMETIED